MEKKKKGRGESLNKSQEAHSFGTYSSFYNMKAHEVAKRTTTTTRLPLQSAGIHFYSWAQVFKERITLSNEYTII